MLAASPQLFHLKRATHVLLLPCFQVMPGPNAFLDECEALVSVSIEDGSLNDHQLRDHLATFGHLQSFYPSNGVCLPLLISPSCLIDDRSSS